MTDLDRVDATDPSEVVYLQAEDVIEFHAQLFGISVEQAVARLRNRPGLEGAVMRPRQHALYAGADLALQAAVLARGIAEGQPFIDGNKRTTLVSLYAFLELNGCRLALAEDRLATLILDLSRGLTADELADRLRRCVVSSSAR